MREEGTGNLLGDEGRGITSVEEGLGEGCAVGVEVIWVIEVNGRYFNFSLYLDVILSQINIDFVITF